MHRMGGGNRGRRPGLRLHAVSDLVGQQFLLEPVDLVGEGAGLLLELRHARRWGRRPGNGIVVVGRAVVAQPRADGADIGVAVAVVRGQQRAVVVVPARVLQRFLR